MKKALRIGGSVLLLGILAWRLDWIQLRQAFAALDLRLWGLSLFVFLLAQLVSSLRWQMLARPLRFDFPYVRYVKLYFIGMFFNLVLPTSIGGDVVRALYLGGQVRRRKAAFLTVLAERGSGLGVLLILACVAALFVPVALPGWMLLMLLATGSALLLGLLALPFLAQLPRLPILGPRLHPLVEVARIYLEQPRLLVLTTLLSVFVQGASVVQAWLISEGLGLSVPVTYYAVVVPLVTLVTLLPISVNGMGLREMGLILMLAPMGVSTAHAVTVSLLMFAVPLVASLAGAGFYLTDSEARPFESHESTGHKSAHHPNEGVIADVQAFRRDSDQGREGQSAAAA